VQTILLVDTDLGFIFWLGQLLDVAGYEALPARSVPDALILLAELKVSIALMIFNLSLPGVANLINTIRRSQPHVRLIGLAEDERAYAHPFPSLDACYRKPLEIGENARTEWLQIVHSVLAGGNAARS
jgi:CheY-like chemotaxis protein